MNSLVQRSLKDLVTNIRSSRGFLYPLLLKQELFIKFHRNNVLNIVKDVEHKLKNDKPGDEMGVKFENYLQPNDGNIAKVLKGIHNADLKKIPIPGETRQDKTNYIIEQFVYNKLKPLRLLDNVQKFNHIKSTSNSTFKIIDITNPIEWFPQARRMKRKIIMHVGPTNSGKTFQALQRLENCSTGYFAGPLRLLAREVYDKFQLRNIRCNLLTGEEIIPDIDQFGNISGLTSGTVEMISLEEEYDVVVLDEIQMIGDHSRGWAWTNVVLGCQLKELHLCGEKSAVPLIRQICQLTGDSFEVHEYNRLSELKVSEFPITQLNDFKKGDCIVAFSKKKILDIKLFLENKTDLKCGVIYGALPPETRNLELERFNSGYYDLLVASDAVGMGLNLNIKRIVFTDLTKYHDGTREHLSNSQVKQIGGRAGRYGVGSESVGLVTTIDSAKLEIVGKQMNSKIEYISQLGLWIPNSLWIRYFAMFPANTKLIGVYKRFESDLKQLRTKTSLNKSLFFISDLKDRKQIATYIDQFGILNGMSIIDQLNVINLPLRLFFDNLKKNQYSSLENLNDEIILEFFNLLKLRSSKSITSQTNLLNFYNTNASQYRNSEILYSHQLMNLKKLEILHRLIMLYLWLSYRYPKSFVDFESVSELKNMTELKISKELDELRNDRLKRNDFLFH